MGIFDKVIASAAVAPPPKRTLAEVSPDEWKGFQNSSWAIDHGYTDLERLVGLNVSLASVGNVRNQLVEAYVELQPDLSGTRNAFRERAAGWSDEELWGTFVARYQGKEHDADHFGLNDFVGLVAKIGIGAGIGAGLGAWLGGTGGATTGGATTGATTGASTTGGAGVTATVTAGEAATATAATVSSAEASAGLVFGGLDGAAISTAELFAMPAAIAEPVTASGGWIDAALEGAKSFLKSPLAGAGLSFLASERALNRADRARQDSLAASNVPMTAPDVVLRGSPALPELGSKTTSALDLTAWVFFAFAVILVLFFVRKS